MSAFERQPMGLIKRVSDNRMLTQDAARHVLREMEGGLVRAGASSAAVRARLDEINDLRRTLNMPRI